MLISVLILVFKNSLNCFKIFKVIEVFLKIILFFYKFYWFKKKFRKIYDKCKRSNDV